MESSEIARTRLTDKDIEEAYKLHQEVLGCRKVLTSNFLFLGERLSKIQEEKLYLAFGCDTFEDYLGMPEIGFGRAWAYRLIQFYRKLELELKIPKEQLVTLSTNKLTVILPVITKENKDVLLEQAKTLSPSDLLVERAKIWQERKQDIKEVVVSLTARQVVELFLFLLGKKKSIDIDDILTHHRYNMVRTGEDWIWETD